MCNTYFFSAKGQFSIFELPNKIGRLFRSRLGTPCLNPFQGFLTIAVFSAANESAMLQLQAFKHPEPNAHFSSPPPRRGATAIASTSNTDAIEPAPESLR